MTCDMEGSKAIKPRCVRGGIVRMERVRSGWRARERRDAPLFARAYPWSQAGRSKSSQHHDISVSIISGILTRVCNLPHVSCSNISEPCLLGKLENRGRRGSKETKICSGNVPKLILVHPCLLFQASDRIRTALFHGASGLDKASQNHFSARAISTRLLPIPIAGLKPLPSPPAHPVGSLPTKVAGNERADAKSERDDKSSGVTE